LSFNQPARPDTRIPIAATPTPASTQAVPVFINKDASWPETIGVKMVPATQDMPMAMA
jgi:hypothetical protein